MWVKQSQTTHSGMVYTTYLYLFMVFIHEYYINMFDQRDGGDCPKNVWLSNPAWDMMVKIACQTVWVSPRIDGEGCLKHVRLFESARELMVKVAVRMIALVKQLVTWWLRLS